MRRDEFVQRLSPFDRAARAKVSGPVSEREFVRFVGTNVLAWSEAETNALASAFDLLAPRLGELRVPLPKTVTWIKTTGA